MYFCEVCCMEGRGWWNFILIVDYFVVWNQGGRVGFVAEYLYQIVGGHVGWLGASVEFF